MKRYLPLFLSLALVGTACDVLEEDVPRERITRFHATIESSASPETKVYADENLKLLWNADDRISIFNKYTYNDEYRFDGKTGDNAGAFSKVSNEGFVTGNDLDYIYSVYPYSQGTSISNSGVLTVTLPSEQTYCENSFGPGANVMVSATTDSQLRFRNLGGYLALQLYGDGVSVSSITVSGKGGEKLSGAATVTAPVGGTPMVTMSDGATGTVTLTCPSPVQLSASADAPTLFWIVVPPTVFSNGITVTVTNDKGGVTEKATSKSITISRNTLSRMAPIEVSNASGALEASSISEIKEQLDGTIVKTKPVIVVAKSVRGLIVSDGTAHILLFGKGLSSAIGDMIEITAEKTTYRDLPELINIQSLLTLSTNNSVNYPSATDITGITSVDPNAAPFDDFYYVHVTAEYMELRENTHNDNTYIYNLKFDNIPYDVNYVHLFYPYDHQDPDEFTVGSVLDIEGFSIGITQNDGAVFILPTKIAVVSTPSEEAGEAVDLGLSVKWASCNLGASSPEEYGDYYAWGETSPKNDYSWSTYKWCNGSSNTLTKYNTLSIYGMVDNKVTLDLSDDAAHVFWSDSWRMPTDAEWTELKEKCTGAWSTQNGIKGYRVTGPNGNSIFLPAAGYRRNTDLYNSVSFGYYWSSSQSTDYPDYAWCFYFNSGNVNIHYDGRIFGFSVRPVYGDYVADVSITSVSLNMTNLTLTTGGSETLVATVSPSNATNKTVTWSSSNTSVANVSSSGVVTAQSAGTATITASAGGKTASCTVTVTQPGSGPEAVDLGLSVKWAPYNVGATKPEEYGDYFAWGETEPRSYYEWSSYKWCNGTAKSLTKYNTSSNYGSVDNKTTLELSDDAARANWGGKWRMPTLGDIEALYRNCTWTWTTRNGVNGYQVTSKINGNSIFLPAAGFRFGGSLGEVGSRAFYWSSSLDTDRPSRAWYLFLKSEGHSTGSYSRCEGRSVRPVTE